jgi:ribosome maturation factor RimP
VHDLVPWRYTLEVSSPGVNRLLLRPSHYRRYLGQRVRIQTRTPKRGRRVFTGPLCGVEETQVSVVDRDVGTVQIPWEEVFKANVEHPFPDGGRKKKGGRRR